MFGAAETRSDQDRMPVLMELIGPAELTSNSELLLALSLLVQVTQCPFSVSSPERGPEGRKAAFMTAWGGRGWDRRLEDPTDQDEFRPP